MDPIILATVTSALTVLATECAKGIANSASKDLWASIKSLLGWQSEPKPSNLPQSIATRLQDDGALAKSILTLLKDDCASESPAAALVGNIDAEKVVVANRIDVAGDFNM